MHAIRVPFFESPADKKRAAVVRSAEENYRATGRTPRFMAEGLGACRTAGDPDDFTNDDTRGIAGREARARAAGICASCPFSGECLRWATETSQTGVFGGEWLRSGVPQMRRPHVARGDA
jgi:hypothetical protein